MSHLRFYRATLFAIKSQPNTRMQSQMLALRLLLLQANQLFKHTSLLTLAGDRAVRVLLTISPDL